MIPDISERLKRLPPYLFAQIDKMKREAINQGRDIIDLGVGDPDTPTPQPVIDRLNCAAKNPANHRYALDQGMPTLRIAIAKWYEKRFGVILDPDKEILPLIGSKEGIAHIPLAFINPGDEVLCPDPCYPPYKSGTIFAEGKIRIMPLLEKNRFLPDISEIKKQGMDRVKMMFLNYPNNPTSATAEAEFFKSVVEFAEKYNIVVVSDAAYSEIGFDGYKSESFLSIEGAKQIGVEFHSLSKTCNMTGWRIGWVCGNSKVVSALARVKSNIDSGIFQAIQESGIEALNLPSDFLKTLNSVYQERRDVLVDGLNRMGWRVEKPRATFYVWIPVPTGYTSAEMCSLLLEKADIVVTPGTGFGPNGEGYIRIALTVDKNRIKQAIERMCGIKIR
jgi:LL-diaminopimelate aminotransferase